jgi:septation ring formation regulator EzrA
MVDSPENLVLTQLRVIRKDISEAQGSLTEIKQRLTNLESGQASIIQHLGNLAAGGAQQQLAADGLTERLVRIERRLEFPAP